MAEIYVPETDHPEFRNRQAEWLAIANIWASIDSPCRDLEDAVSAIDEAITLYCH